MTFARKPLMKYISLFFASWLQKGLDARTEMSARGDIAGQLGCQQRLEFHPTRGSSGCRHHPDLETPSHRCAKINKLRPLNKTKGFDSHPGPSTNGPR